MSREQKVVFLGVLTTLVYAASIWVERGVFLYPFPLNEFIFAVVTFQVIRFNYSKNRNSALLSAICAAFFLISSPYFWTFFLSTAALSQFVEGILYQYLKLGYYVILLLWMIYTVFQIKGGSKYAYLIFIIPLFVLHPLLSMPFFETLGISVIALISTIKRIHKPYHLLWILLAYLTAMKYLLFYFN